VLIGTGAARLARNEVDDGDWGFGGFRDVEPSATASESKSCEGPGIEKKNML